MKYYLTILIFASILFTGCLDANNAPDCTPVDESSFLEEYADKEDYTETESGLIYKVINMGDGEIPQENQYVFVTYTGKLVNGEPFNEATELIFFPLNLSFDHHLGFMEGISIMREGSTYELVIPPELAFGNNPPQGSKILCGAVVIYEITLDSFLRDVDTFLEQNAAREDMLETESGLQYRVIEEGEGESPDESDIVRVKYKGSFTNGVIFDQTTGENTAEFNLNSGLISGFAEGLLLMTEGSKYEFFIPPNLAYGSQPPSSAIPPNAILVFEVELVEIL